MKKMNKGIVLTLMGCISLTSTAQVSITTTPDGITIGNQFLSRSFSIAGHQLKTTEITNKRTDGQPAVLRPAAGSEEFSLSVVSKAIEPKPAARKGWTATVDSWCKDSKKGGEASYIVDGDLQSFWHSNYRDDGTGEKKLPHYFQIDMQRSQTFRSFAYVPRQAADNGRFAKYELYVSDSPNNIEQPKNLVSKGELEMNGDGAVWVNLPRAAKGRYLRMKELSSQNGAGFGTCSEFYISTGSYVSNKRILKASNFSIADAKDIKVENIENGKRVTFNLQPATMDGINWDVDVVYEMKNNDHFMRKYLLVSVPQDQREKARIDYLDIEDLGVANAAGTWTHPSMGEGVGGMSGYHISLGQPVYVEGMFLGSEFPETENEISDGMAHIRYYSGKSLAELNDESRLNANGQFATWKNVLGATRSVTDMDVIRSDFFSYINTIAKPINLRLQYNSWFDWMMDITETNILSSFKEMERGLSQNGVRPMDSYVVDDGWNAYGPFEKDNTTGFWQFNSNFPNGLKNPSDFAHRVSSNFGIWLGPRGGYNYNYDFAKFLEAHGNGTLNKVNYDIVTGDKQYLKKLEEFFLKCQNDYDVNYWKLDGFCARPPQPSTNGRYITGGRNNMYYMTEHWERWSHLLNNLYANADKRHSNLWINLTCYINPSPWLLQWGKSVWMQISADMGRIKVDEGRDNDVDQLLTYRDDRYFDFIKTRQFQFPFSNIFNHDPSYGKTYCVAPNAMNDDQFRTYLYMMATRGAAFWELLYSYNLLDEGGKWMINAEALKFLQENYSILRNAKLIGETPAKGNCYGYSCWDAKEGIISVRNPKSEAQTFKIRLNRTIGVPENARNLWRTLVMKHNSDEADDNSRAFNYNDEITINLKGGEVRIWKFSPVKDETPASLLTVKANSATCDTVIAQFNEPITPQTINFQIQQGKNTFSPKAVSVLADLRSVCIVTNQSLKPGSYTLAYRGLNDWNNNAGAGSMNFTTCKSGLVWEGKNLSTNKSKTVKEVSIEGTGDFSVAINLPTGISGNGVLASQPNAFVVGMKDGHVIFIVGNGLTVTSKSTVTDGKAHNVTCVREKNGMLKIYIDSDEVDNSVYNAQKVNENLPKAAFSMGDKAFGKAKMNVRLINRALNFKEVNK